MKRTLPIAVAVTLSPLTAATVNISFHNGGVTETAMTSRPDGAIVSTSTDTWNNIVNTVGTTSGNGKTGYTFSGISLDLEDGSSSGATLSGTTGFTGFNNNGWQTADQDSVMMEGWYGFRNTESIVITNLPQADANGYTVTIFGDSNTLNRDMFYAINGGTQQLIEDRANFSGTFSPGDNFVTFTGLTTQTLTITGNQGAQSGRSAINGIIIEFTPIPEPSVALLGLLGGLFFIRRPRS